MTVNGYRLSFWSEDVLKLDYSDGSTTVNILKTTELHTLDEYGM